MKKFFALAAVLVFLMGGCVTTGTKQTQTSESQKTQKTEKAKKTKKARKAKATKLAAGKNITILVLTDRNAKGLRADKARAQKQMGDWMEKDLVKVLKKAGYNARIINKRSEYKAGSGNYLLKVRIVKYNPGSAAARHFVGFGAGSASMDTHYELVKGKSTLLSKDHGVGSGVGWKKIARKLNVQMRDAITKKVNSL